MRKCLLVFGLLSTLFLNAQTNKPVVKAAEVEPYTIISKNPQKNLIVASLGNDYENRRYALLEYFSKKKLTPFIFESIGSFYERDFELVKLNSKLGIMNTTGKIIIPCIYEDLNSIVIDGYTYYVAYRGGRYGVINGQNEIMVPFEYDRIVKEYYYPTYLEVTKDGKMGLLNLVSRKMNGNILVPFIYDDLQYLNSYLVIAGKDGKYGVIDIYNNKNIVLPLEYQFVSYKDNNTIVTYKDSYVKYQVSGNKITKLAN